MLRNVVRRLAPRAKNHEELVKLRSTAMPVQKTDEEAGVTFRDTRPRPENESVEVKRRRLIYQSRYRGMVEMDLILGSFAQEQLNAMGSDVLDEYDTLLRQFDNDLFNWIIGNQPVPENIASLRAYQAVKTYVVNHRGELVSNKL